MSQLREHQENSRLFAEPEDFNPSPNNALGIRAHAIQDFYNHQSTEALTEYLRGLGYVRAQLIAARDVLNADGKKKYEAYIKSAVETLPARFCGLKPYYIDTLTDLMSIPFRRSTEKDRRELSDSLCLMAEYIEKYRYRGADERYRDYARTIVNGIDTEQLPPMIAGLIVQELTSLVNCACSTGVMAYTNSGITHEELWRFEDHEEYSEEYPDNEIPDDASPLDMLDIYAPHNGIALQSIWYGYDIYVDDFIVSLAGGLLFAKSLQVSPANPLT